MKRTLFSKKYGVDLIHFIHGTEQVLHGSTKVDDSVRLLQLEGNKYIRYYSGHTKRYFFENKNVSKKKHK